MVSVKVATVYSFVFVVSGCASISSVEQNDSKIEQANKNIISLSYSINNIESKIAQISLKIDDINRKANEISSNIPQLKDSNATTKTEFDKKFEELSNSIALLKTTYDATNDDILKIKNKVDDICFADQGGLTTIIPCSRSK